MKSVVMHRPGGLEVLEYVDSPKPSPAAGEVLIHTKSIGVGWPDVLIRSGRYKWMPPMPTSPGSDLAGVVEAVGAGVTTIRVGQKVLLSARDLPERGGCYVEFRAVSAEAVYPLADHVDLDEAVALPNYQFAYGLLHDAAKVSSGQSLFITGPAGGVGSALTQMAKLAGVTVIGAVSTEEKAAFARAQGTDHLVMYRTESVIDRVKELTGGRGVDFAFDHVSGTDSAKMLDMLAPFGTWIPFNGTAPFPAKDVYAELMLRMSRCLGVRTYTAHYYDQDPAGRRRLMRAVVELLNKGQITPHVAARLPLSEAATAHRMVEQGEGLGKIVLHP